MTDKPFGGNLSIVALRISGGSLAVGVIDRVVTVKELIDNIVQGAEEILAGQGPLGQRAKA